MKQASRIVQHVISILKPLKFALEIGNSPLSASMSSLHYSNPHMHSGRIEAASSREKSSRVLSCLQYFTLCVTLISKSKNYKKSKIALLVRSSDFKENKKNVFIFFKNILHNRYIVYVPRLNCDIPCVRAVK